MGVLAESLGKTLDSQPAIQNDLLWNWLQMGIE
jgi:hypothetical protein